MPQKYSFAQRELQSALASDPRSYAYAYDELDKKYPIAPTRPIVPAWIQDEIDEDELKRKSNEIAYKEKQYQMQLMDSQLNRENARLTQAPMIRKEIAELNPQSDDFQEKLLDIYQRNPIGYEDKSLQEYIVKPLLNTHNKYIDNKNYIERLRQKPASFTEMEKANDLYFDLNTKKMAGEALTPTEEDILSNIESRMQGGYSTRQPSAQQKTNEIDPVMQQAMQVIQKYPNKKDEVNKRLISVGKQPIP